LAGRNPGVILGPGYQNYGHHSRCEGNQGTQDGP